MFDTPEKRRNASRWVIETVTCCALIYLAFRHIGNIANAIQWLFDLCKPMFIGSILALVLNVPMSFIERFLKANCKMKKGTRPLAILLALVLVLGLFVGVAVLVVPELLEAVSLIIQIATGGLDQLSALDASLADSPLGDYFSGVNIDWQSLKHQLEGWLTDQRSGVMDGVMGSIGSVAGQIVPFFFGTVFSIYILGNKETLKRQGKRLLRAWLPKRFTDGFLHVCHVCGRTFKLFVAGQATEAIILGTLCMIGMAILRIPYAPMVGALVGVTALIPIVGAFVGTIVGAIMILTVDPFKALMFVVFLLILQQVEGNMIYPKVVGAKIKLPAMWVLAAVTVGGNLAGPIGMLLGVPAASAAYALLREATEKREIAQLEKS